MTLSLKEEQEVRRYLLGESPEEEARRIEERLIGEDGFAEQLLLIEDELIEDYARGALGPQERGWFESRFLTTPRRRRKLMLVRGLSRYAARAGGAHGARAGGAVQKPAAPFGGLFTFRWGLAVGAALLLAAGFGVWRGFFHRSPVERGLAALGRAYRAERPLEARITGLGYAPFTVRRGDGSGGVDARARDLSAALLLQAADDAPGPVTLHALGRYYLTQGRFDDAVRQFEEALGAAPDDARLRSDLGAALLEQAKVNRLKGDLGRSGVELGRSLEALTQALTLDPALSEALFNRALCKQQMGLESEAAADWKEYLAKDSRSEWAAEARQNLAQIEERKKRALLDQNSLFENFLSAYDSRDGDRAWETFRRARARTGNRIAERLIDGFLESAARTQQAESARLLPPLAYAGELEFQKTGDRFTLDLAAYYGDSSPKQLEVVARARGLMKLAADRYNQSEMEAALDLYAKARDEFRRAGDECEGTFAEGWVSYCQVRLGDSAACLALCERLVRLYERKGYKSLLAHALNTMADAYTGQDELSQAIEYAGRSMKVSEEIGDSGCLLRNLSALQSINWHLGKYEESLKAGLTALGTEGHAALDPKRAWVVYTVLSSSYLSLGNPVAALETQKEALYMAVESQWPIIKSLSNEHLALIYGTLGQYSEAVRHGQLSLEECEKIQGEKTRANLLASAHTSLGSLYRQAGDFAPAVSHYDEAIRLFGKTDYQFLLHHAHKGKFFSYLAIGDDEKAVVEMEKGLGVLRRFREKILEESNRNAFFDQGQDIYDAAIGFEYTNRKSLARAFQYSEESRARSLLDAQQTGAQIVKREASVELHFPSVSQPLNLAAIQQRLPDKTQIIQYTVLPEKLIAWVVTPSNLFAVEKKLGADELTKLVASYVQLISTPASSVGESAVTQAKELYAALITSVEPYLDRDRDICLIPDKALHDLPFSSLISPDSGRYLIEDYTLLLSPSATTFILCSEAARAKERKPEESLLCIGNPRVDYSRFPALQDLPAAGIEADRVAALYPRATLLARERAKEVTVREAMARADVIHIAGHSLADERSPLLSKLLLTPGHAEEADAEVSDGLLHAYELYQMKLTRPRLAVLSACQTGVGRAYRGEGVMSLTRPFIAAGVPIVVASYWNVDSASAAELMLRFHKLRRQMPTAQALRAAQTEMLRGAERGRRSPSAWAAFAVFGGHTGY